MSIPLTVLVPAVTLLPVTLFGAPFWAVVVRPLRRRARRWVRGWTRKGSHRTRRHKPAAPEPWATAWPLPGIGTFPGWLPVTEHVTVPAVLYAPRVGPWMTARTPIGVVAA